MRKPKNILILEWMKSGKTINQTQASEMFDCLGLNQAISYLKKKGEKIEVNYNRNGRYMRTVYFMDVIKNEK
jgi:hypothetical protein